MQKKSNIIKKTKLHICLGIGLGAIAAGSVALLVGKVKSTHGSDLYHHVLQFGLFDDDKKAGATLTGKTSFEFNKKIQLDEIKDKPVAQKFDTTGNEIPFVDWVDEAGNPIHADQEITSKTYVKKATATFKDYWEKQGVRLATLQFRSDDPNDIFVGSTTLAVKLGRMLGTVNQPRVISKDETISRRFTGWKIKGTNDMVTATTPITGDMTLVPTFEVDVNFTFNATDQGEITQGSSIVPTMAGEKFSTLNQPTVKANNENYVFEGWYSDSALTTKWSGDTLIQTSNANAYAKYIDVQTVGGFIINFVKNSTSGQPDITFTGNLKIAGDKTTPLGNVNKPGVNCTQNYRVKNWQISENGTSGWTDIDPTQPYSGSSTNIYLRPVMIPNIDRIDVVGPNNAPIGFKTLYHAYVSPQVGETSETVTWKLYDSTDKELASTIATITDGELDVKPGVNAQTIKIVATSTLDTTVKGSISVNLNAPYANSSDFWTTMQKDGQQVWYKLENVCEPTEDNIYAIDDSTGTRVVKQTWTRTTFNAPVYVGDQIKVLPSAFLAGCEAFNSDITLNNTETINTGFMNDCKVFNKQINLKKVQSILDFFMCGCTSFNNGSTATKTNSLDLDATSSIGNSFLEGCTAFNSPISLSNDAATGIKYIGNDFLHNCTSFDQDITFPATLTYIGERCMHNCDAFIGEITVEAPIDAFKGKENSLDFSTWNADALIYKIGFLVGGTHADEFLAAFPTINDPGSTTTSPAYRTSEKSIIITNFATADWADIIKVCTRFEKMAPSERTMKRLCKAFSKNYITEGTTYEDHLTELIGLTKTTNFVVDAATNTSYDLTVEVIGACHDKIAGTDKYTALTFITTKVISYGVGTTTSTGNNGVELKMQDKNTLNYLQSNVSVNLNGSKDEVDPNLRIGDTDTYINKSCLDMVKDGNATLFNSIKTIDKEVSVASDESLQQSTTYEKKSYTTKLFLPTTHEYGMQSTDNKDGTRYPRYVNRVGGNFNLTNEKGEDGRSSLLITSPTWNDSTTTDKKHIAKPLRHYFYGANSQTTEVAGWVQISSNYDTSSNIKWTSFQFAFAI